jgi:hypothetical protein
MRPNADSANASTSASTLSSLRDSGATEAELATTVDEASSSSMT